MYVSERSYNILVPLFLIEMVIADSSVQIYFLRYANSPFTISAGEVYGCS